jgi:hypothetical protein
LGWVSAIDSQGRTIWIVDAHRDDGKRFIVHADEKLSAFVELESAIRAQITAQTGGDFVQTRRRGQKRKAKTKKSNQSVNAHKLLATIRYYHESVLFDYSRRRGLHRHCSGGTSRTWPTRRISWQTF